MNNDNRAGFAPLLVLVVVLVLVIGGGAAYIMSRDSSPRDVSEAESQANTSNDETGQPEVSGKYATSMTDLLKMGKRLKCEFGQAFQAGSMKGTVYISGKKVRGDYEILQPQLGAMQSHMIHDGEWAYTWTSLMTQGTKMRVSDFMKDTPSSSDGKKESIDLNQKMDFTCDTWNEDSAKFALPTGIIFTDVSQSMKQIQDNFQGLQDTKCAACANLPEGESKTMCLQTLGCN